MTKKKQVGYKKPPTEHQWQPGQSGNPSGKKKAAKKLPQPLPETLAAQLGEISEITINGKKQKMSLSEALVRMFLRNAMIAPLKQQGDALKLLQGLGVFDLQNSLFDQEDEYADPFSEYHRRLLKICQDDMDGVGDDDEGQYEYEVDNEEGEEDDDEGGFEDDDESENGESD